VIEAHGLTKRYGPITAVDQLSFDVRPGVVTGFLGPNGSGKSTTMRLILGLDAADHGTVKVAGRAYHDLPFPLREVGALLDLLRQKGATITADGPESLSITGMENRDVDIIGAQACLTLYELVTQRASLKDASWSSPTSTARSVPPHRYPPRCLAVTVTVGWPGRPLRGGGR